MIHFFYFYQLLVPVIIFLVVLIIDNYIERNSSKIPKRLYLINSWFKNLSYIKLNLIFSFILILIFTFLNNDFITYDYVTKYFNSDFISEMADRNRDMRDLANREINVGENAVINVNNPNLNASISTRGINNIAAAISSAGGVTAGIKVAQYVGGPPVAKVMAGAATMLIVQATTGIMSKVLNSNSNVRQNRNDFVNTVNNYFTNKVEYPLNLLFDIDVLLYAALLLMSVITNIYLVRYLSTLDYEGYIPNNYMGNLIKRFIKKYISIWSKLSGYLLAYCIILLFVTLIIVKLSLSIVIASF